MSVRRRARGHIPPDALIVRPAGRGTLQNAARSPGSRLWLAVTGVAALVAVFVFARPDGQTGLAALLSVPPVVALGVFVFRQPGAYLYAYDHVVGLRNGFRTRYEVPDEAVKIIRVGLLPYWGVLAEGVSLETADSRSLLTHANARYPETGLQELAVRIGAELRDE
jgi:hypothetical protein